MTIPATAPTRTNRRCHLHRFVNVLGSGTNRSTGPSLTERTLPVEAGNQAWSMTTIGAGVQTANSRIVIHLNKAAPKALTVGWFVLNPP